MIISLIIYVMLTSVMTTLRTVAGLGMDELDLGARSGGGPYRLRLQLDTLPGVGRPKGVAG